MQSTHVAFGLETQELGAIQPRKRFKASELPLSATQRSTIDGLLHTIKKNGEYDTLRKTVYAQFESSDAKNDLVSRLNELSDAEIDRDPSLLSRDPRKAANLLQGAVDRSDIYQNVEQVLDKLVSEHLDHVLAAGRAIRTAEIGEEAAAEEEKRGNITDAEYAKEAAIRREAKEAQRQLDEARKRSEEEKERVRADLKKKAAELERLKKREIERLEREKIKQLQKEERKIREEEENKKRKDYEQRRTGNPTGQRSSHQTTELSRSRHSSAERLERAGKVLSPPGFELKVEDAAATTTPIPLIDEEAVEREALEKLLREGAELAAKSSTKPHVERSDSIEPPHRRAHMLKSKSSNISPSKTADARPPTRSNSVKPVLSFSATNSKPSEPLALQHARNKTPPSGPKSQLQYRSLSRSCSQWDEQRVALSNDSRTRHNPTAIPQPDHLSKDHKRDMREASHRSQSFAREDTKEKETGKEYSREETHNRSGRSKLHHQEYDDHTRKSSQHARSRSRDARYTDKDGYIDGGYDREGRDRRRDRSRSPYKSSRPTRHHDERRSSNNGHIDRYEPQGEIKGEDTERYRSRVRERDQRDEDREVQNGWYTERRNKDDERYRERRDERERERHEREDERYRDRDRDRERGREDREDARYRERRDHKDTDRERGRDEKGDDRYRERRSERDRDRGRKDRDRDGGGEVSGDERERDRDRDRDRDRRDGGRHRDSYTDTRDDGKDRDGGKERRDDGRDHRGYGTIDRYMPSGGRDDTIRERGRDRDRDR
ncbi:MAG: hypothetical protein Q9224_002721 [Gallowayella concinna]